MNVSLHKVPKFSLLMEDVKIMIRSCYICAECKPRFHKPDPAHLIKATQPFE